MNLCNCAFGVSAGKFLRFIIHGHGIEVDPDQIKDIWNVGSPMCKREMQSFLSKVNYLRRFISNSTAKVNVFTPILRLKNNANITWGQSINKRLSLSKIIYIRS
jgi:hypothetical protein